LQGVWSSDDTSGIPMSRPEQYGDRLYLNEQELAERATNVERGVQRAENEATSSFRGDFARRALPQTSLIVDPANGRLPAFTPEGLKRPMPRGTYGNGPLDSYTDFSGYERCITRGIVGSTLRVVYGNGQRIVQARAWWRSRTRWCTTLASSTRTIGRTSTRRYASISAIRARIGKATADRHFELPCCADDGGA
jgi:hypothetical protein